MADDQSDNPTDDEYSIPRTESRRAKAQKKPRLTMFSEYLPADREIEKAGLENEEVYAARQLLLEKTKQCLPEFLRELSMRIYPLYKELAESGYAMDAVILEESPYRSLSDGRLKQGLADWAATFNAQTEWLLNRALRILYNWHAKPKWREQLQLSSVRGHYSVKGPSAEEFQFRYEPWNVQLVKWPDHRAAVRKAFEQKLAEYEQKMRASVVAYGFRRARRQYSPVNVEWFVLYQFAGKSSKAIADAYAGRKGTDESTVLKGIKAAANLLAWNHLRQTHRPRKTR